MPCLKIEREGKPRKTKESIVTMKFSPEPKRENKANSQFNEKLNFEVIKKIKRAILQWWMQTD